MSATQFVGLNLYLLLDLQDGGSYMMPAGYAAQPHPSMVYQQQQQMVPYGVEIPNRVFVGGCPYNVRSEMVYGGIGVHHYHFQ